MKRRQQGSTMTGQLIIFDGQNDFVLNTVTANVPTQCRAVAPTAPAAPITLGFSQNGVGDYNTTWDWALKQIGNAPPNGYVRFRYCYNGVNFGCNDCP